MKTLKIIQETNLHSPPNDKIIKVVTFPVTLWWNIWDVTLEFIEDEWVETSRKLKSSFQSVNSESDIPEGFIFRKISEEWIEREKELLPKMKTENEIHQSLSGILEFDGRGEAICPMISFSKSALEADKKNLMAHIMFDLGIFKSVGEAKRNGWDKPIELGEFCVTKKKIKFEVKE